MSAMQKYNHKTFKFKLDQLFIQQRQNLLTYALDIPQVTGFEKSPSSETLWCKSFILTNFSFSTRFGQF